MKRRRFNLLSGTALAALGFGHADAQTTVAADPGLLKTTLTPFGAERAGNADDSIPAWTGGYTTVPAGWQPADYMPDFFADEQPVVIVNAANMADHADRLTEGVMDLMQKQGYSIKVYPCHRTSSAPQWVYDNMAKNVTTATLNPAGGRFGFANAYGGVPFPIPNTSDPLAAGAQIVWNHITRWSGYAYIVHQPAYAANDGEVTLTADNHTKGDFPFYYQTGSIDNFNGNSFQQYTFIAGPATLRGEQVLAKFKTDPYQNPTQTWEVLNGQGRVRKAPEISFDTPSQFANGIANFDEYYGFSGSLERYDWTYITKKEMYIPYNCNGLYLPPADVLFGPKFLNPDTLRWELHRVWVVEARLHPGERNVLARRRLYVDEDSWTATIVDCWDANDTLYKVDMYFNIVRPEVPCLGYGSAICHNLQTGDYAWLGGPVNQKAAPEYVFVDSLPNSVFDPEAMAAASQY